jgi:hypothetical protein
MAQHRLNGVLAITRFLGICNGVGQAASHLRVRSHPTRLDGSCGGGAAPEPQIIWARPSKPEPRHRMSAKTGLRLQVMAWGCHDL